MFIANIITSTISVLPDIIDISEIYYADSTRDQKLYPKNSKKLRKKIQKNDSILFWVFKTHTKCKKMHTKQCKKHTNLKNAKNEISVLTDILPGGGELK